MMLDSQNLPPLTAVHAPPPLNFNSDFAQHFLKKIVRAADLQEVRAKIMSDKHEGIELKERVKKMVRFSAANLITAANSHSLGVALLDEVKARRETKAAEVALKMEKADAAYLKLCAAADETIAAAPPDHKMWTVDQLKAFLKPLKRKSDKLAMPSKRAELLALYSSWQHRKRRTNVSGVLVEDLTLRDEVSDDLEEKQLPVNVEGAAAGTFAENTKPEAV